ncbi:MAG: CoA pyrophosphatase [Thermoplasmata archaeon]|nr:CoA pyrophosphatase [Thermoplasmata archaeon]
MSPIDDGTLPDTSSTREWSRLLDALARTSAPSPSVETAQAAVTIVFRPGESATEVLLLERAHRPEDPGSGQIAFPGGRTAPIDRLLSDTALRELEEEVGLRPDDVELPLRYLATTPARAFGVNVGVFATRLGWGARSAAPADPTEVSSVFWLPLTALGIPTQVSMSLEGLTRAVEATVFEGKVLWGFTRRVLFESLVSLGLSPGRDAVSVRSRGG